MFQVYDVLVAIFPIMCYDNNNQEERKMSKLLEQVNKPEDLKKLSIIEKQKLAKEIRELLIDTISKNGGHLASNLGVVELTIALHSVYNVPTDKIIWDVGHQTYVHKILTGRKQQFHTLRQLDGIAGFPKTLESECDCFNTGHSSTSISVALGMAKARDLKKENSHVLAVIGDGALTGGMALEALNDAGSSNTNLTVILNDNEMSIDKCVGGISMKLSNLRTKKFYTQSNNYVKKVVKKIPVVGEKIIHYVRKMKYSLKHLLIQNMFFEDIGFRYLGPIDGHDIEKLESMLKISRDLEGPVLIHVVTKKGYGYLPAEREPEKFHSTPSFEIETGKSINGKKADYSKIFGDKLIELAKKDEKIVAITASMKEGTGLLEFANLFPNRFFDVGIAEQHALGFAAGLAKNGMKPVVPIYSSFYQRCYDQVIHDICIQNLPVVMCVDRAGLVGNDGETHQGIFDLSFFNIIPNLTIMAPKNFKELEQMLEFSLSLNSPVVIRYPRGQEGNMKYSKEEAIQLGRAEKLEEGKDITILAIGKMVDRALQISNDLKQNNISVEVINVRFLKPFDEKTILKSIEKTKQVITIEDNILKGGLASTVQESIIKHNLKEVSFLAFGYPDKFIGHGKVEEVEKLYGLDVKSISSKIKSIPEMQ